MKTEEEYRSVISDIKSRIGKASLVAVSKTRSMEEIMLAYKAGAREFGENHVQEIVQKFSGERPADMKVYMIGHLQSNKVNKVVPLVDMIQSVDSFSLLQKIDRAAENCGFVMDVLLEVNTSGEEAKSGFESREEVISCLEKSSGLKNVRVRGFMTVGPLNGEYTKAAFRKAREISEECKKLFPSLDLSILSMGMSSDYISAIEEGSTMVRIGTAVFGERNYD